MPMIAHVLLHSDSQDSGQKPATTVLWIYFQGES